MAKWSLERIEERLKDLRARLALGQTLEKIARAWGTSKQNVSQFRRRHLDREKLPDTLAGRGSPISPESPEPSAAEDSSLHAKAYQMLLARDKLILELESQARELKYRLFVAQQGALDPREAKERLKSYLAENRSA